MADTQVYEGVALSAVCADGLGAHVYRHQVAEFLFPHWRNRAIALQSCGEAGARLRCECCQMITVVPFRCGARSCPTCAHIASAVAVEKLSGRAGAVLAGDALARLWEGPAWPAEKRWWLFTGTQQTAGAYGAASRYEHSDLLAAIRRVRAGWGEFWRATPWGARVYERSARTGILGTRLRRDTMFTMGLEVAPGGMVHLHAAVFGEQAGATQRAQSLALRPLWEKAIGRAGFVKVSRMKAATPEDFKKGLREVLKYATKGDASGRHARNAAAVERAMRGVRRVEMGGALRARGWQASPLELATYKQSCTECGEAEGWEWAGLRAPSYVVGNGGFGVDALAKQKRARPRRDITEPELRDVKVDIHFAPDEWGAEIQQD